MFWLIVNPIYSLAGVVPGSSAEALSVPAQQLAYTRVENSKSLTQAEKDFIDEIIPDWKHYNPTISDPVKAKLRVDSIKARGLDSILTYVNVGMKNPSLFLTAFLRLNVGYWYPSSDYNSAAYDSPDEYLRLMGASALLVDSVST